MNETNIAGFREKEYKKSQREEQAKVGRYLFVV